MTTCCAILMTAMQVRRALCQEVERPRPIPVNAFPPGFEIDHCTHKVFLTLLARYPAPLNHAEIRQATGLGRGAVSWSVRYLSARDLIIKLPDSRRHGYLRYRAVL